MVGPGRYKWYQSRSPTSMWWSVPFDPIIPWDTTRMLSLHGGGGGGWGGGGGECVFVISHIGYGRNFEELYKYVLLST